MWSIKTCKFYGSQRFRHSRPYLRDVVGGRKKIAGRQWLCYCLASAVAKHEQQQNNGCMFFFTPPFFEIQIIILRLAATDRKKDRPYEIRRKQNVSLSYSRMQHVLVTF
jgi:hypothetical protein